MTINSQVLQYCAHNLGTSVGRGECYDLADFALRAAGARSAPDFGTITDDADYVWGTETTLMRAQPGDIVQFRNFRVRVDNVDGWREDTRGAPNHTAIIKEILSNGRVMLYEQNVGTGPSARRVQTHTLHLLAGGFSGDTVTIHGGFHIYHPQQATTP